MSKISSLPFAMSLNDSLSVWRAETFYSKEPETIEWIKFFAENKELNCEVFVDVGANVGIYTLLWLSLDSESLAISVEPSKVNYDLLAKNIELNKFSRRVKIVNSPLSSRNGSGFYKESDLRPGSSSYRFYFHDDLILENKESIESLTLDFLLDKSVGTKILKIDVDGNDFDILRGAEFSLKNNQILSILIESPLEQQLEIKNYLKVFGFKPDERFNDLKNHSDIRRIAKGNLERNRVYTNFDLKY
jgi:FkbM family methyltransferase